ncbi:MAG: carboxymuconolactone decarboxylase family protein [Acidimicrobiales bacterium]|jgi:AhpD family alkylhydroperoxidase
MTHAHETLEELREPSRELRRLIPDVYAGFAGLDRAAMAEGALSVKCKELIALAIGATRECDACLASHGRGAARAGASEEEVAEAMGVVILMNGGPGTVWGPRALEAFREFSAGDA